MIELNEVERESKLELTQLSLFDESALDSEQATTSACPESAIEQWKNLYAAIAQYAKQLAPTESK